MGRKFKDLTHEFNPEFEKLLSDHEHGQLFSRHSYVVVRPAYAYTSQCFNEHWREGVVPGKYKAKLREKK